MSDDEERRAWLCLGQAALEARFDGVRLAQALGGPRSALEAPLTTLRGHLRPEPARSALQLMRRPRCEGLLRRAGATGQRLVTPADAEYPRCAFRGMVEPPCILFVRGRVPPEDTPCAAVVGTRDASGYGLRVARTLGRDLATAGVWVVSGFAVGVDGAAHEGALESASERGGTLAVLGCGLDHPYPVAHVDLKEEICRAGGIVSEHPPGTPPRKWHFPRRNRMVAAWAGVVVVVEAPARSGALITARLALDQGRDVASVPGSVFHAGRKGCHRLLREGAALCEDARDVLALLGLEGAEPGGARAAPPAEGPEAIIWRLLDDCDAVEANEICRRTGLAPHIVAAGLAELEISGHVRRLPGVGFLRG